MLRQRTLLLVTLLLLPMVSISQAKAATLPHGLSRCSSTEEPKAHVTVSSLAISAPEVIRPGEALAFDRAADVDDGAPWYIDGVRISGSHPPQSCFHFNLAGEKRFEVVVASGVTLATALS